MNLTKTLYREFLQCPKYAWFHVHNKEFYNYIQEHLYWPDDLEEEATESEEKEVENLFLSQYSDNRVLDLSENRGNPEILHQRTLQAIFDKIHVIYQGWLLFGGVFTIFDILLYDKDNDGYILLEIKSKNSIRNDNKVPVLLPEILHDVSIQQYVLKNFTKIMDIQIGHLNGDYVKKGEVDVYSITTKESVLWEVVKDEEIKDNIAVIIPALLLTEAEFERRYPYNWCKPLLYFGPNDTSRSKWSIFSIPRVTQAKIWPKGAKSHAIVEWHSSNFKNIEDIDQESIDALSDSYKLFIRKYLWGDIIDKATIKWLLDQLEFPLFFYDYETINCPIPLLDNTRPWQQVVCQYSLHKLENIEALDHPEQILHFEWLIESCCESNRDLIEKFVEDIGPVWAWTFIVWHKTFECSRNKEIAEEYPEFADVFVHINEHTFDLKDLVSGEHDYAYFLRDFKWSASIKYILPAMTDMTYDWMEIPNWKIAAWTIKNLLRKENELDRSNLLKYCKQDTFAMVKIYHRLLVDIA